MRRRKGDKLTAVKCGIISTIREWNIAEIRSRWLLGQWIAKILDNPAVYPGVTLNTVEQWLRADGECPVKLRARTLRKAYQYYKAFTEQQIDVLVNTNVSKNTVNYLATVSDASCRADVITGLSTGTIAPGEVRAYAESDEMSFGAHIDGVKPGRRVRLERTLFEMIDRVRKVSDGGRGSFGEIMNVVNAVEDCADKIERLLTGGGS
jgi:hypothetical protein